jgi:hypothetical protein
MTPIEKKIYLLCKTAFEISDITFENRKKWLTDWETMYLFAIMRDIERGMGVMQAIESRRI